MCGIVGAIAHRNVIPILLDGLQRLEYRGYDSAGLCVVNDNGLQRLRRVGKVAELAGALKHEPIQGLIGIAHTRWATHGVPAERNAHPHVSSDRVAVVHNGIIENHEQLRRSQQSAGFHFSSDTDTEVIAHQVALHLNHGETLREAVRLAVSELTGAYAIAVIDREAPDRMIVARNGSPLVIGLGDGEQFIASDIQALLPITRRFIYLENGDLAELDTGGVRVFDSAGAAVDRPVKESSLTAGAAERGQYAHFMLKEIHEQPEACAATLEGRIVNGRIPDEIMGPRAAAILDQVRAVQIVACGTSYHAALVAKYWLEGLADLPCQVEIASEFRYRRQYVTPGTLFIAISQSGETADTLAALSLAKQEPRYIATLAVCNVPESSLQRESDLTLMTRAGVEVGVASTKAFLTQLCALLLSVILIGRRHGLAATRERELIDQLTALPSALKSVLAADAEVAALAHQFAGKSHALFLGRGLMYPIAMEGALKLKEISYIHAEAYAAGELKHGPLALVDAEMPVVAVAPNDALLEKLKSNLQEVRSRHGVLYVFADRAAGFENEPGVNVLNFDNAGDIVGPMVFTVPLQLLAYHAAVLRGTDVDRPRNLAKSVTVE